MTATATLSVTLSRASKIAERLKAGLAERNDAAAAALACRSGVPTALAVQKDSFEARASAGADAVAQALAWNQALVAVRKVIGAANQATGVSDLMAELEGVNRDLRFVTDVLSRATVSDVTWAQGCEVRQVGQYETTVTVRVASEAGIADLTDKQAALRRQAFQVSDRIAEANATRVDLVIPAAIADSVGG